MTNFSASRLVLNQTRSPLTASKPCSQRTPSNQLFLQSVVVLLHAQERYLTYMLCLFSTGCSSYSRCSSFSRYFSCCASASYSASGCLPPWWKTYYWCSTTSFSSSSSPPPDVWPPLAPPPARKRLKKKTVRFDLKIQKIPHSAPRRNPLRVLEGSRAPP